MNIKEKLTSRKFWMAVAAICGSIGTTIAGFSTDKDAVTIAGIICTAISACIYNVCEALIDAEAVNKEMR